MKTASKRKIDSKDLRSNGMHMDNNITAKKNTITQKLWNTLKWAGKSLYDKKKTISFEIRCTIRHKDILFFLCTNFSLKQTSFVFKYTEQSTLNERRKKQIHLMLLTSRMAKEIIAIINVGGNRRFNIHFSLLFRSTPLEVWMTRIYSIWFPFSFSFAHKSSLITS